MNKLSNYSKISWRIENQYVEINTKSSNILVNGNLSVFQGSVLSCMLYNIYTLDLPSITHAEKHTNHYEHFCCESPFMLSYVDDLFSVIECEDVNVEEKG